MSVVLFLFCAWLAYHAVQDARTRAWAGPKTPAMRSRAAAPRTSGRGKSVLRSAGSAAGSAGSAVLHPSNAAIRAQAKADAQRVWTEATATDWLEQQRHARANGTATATTAPPRPTLKQRLRLVPYTPPPPDPATGGGNAQPANGGAVNNRPGYPYPHDRETAEERGQRERAARYQAQQNGTSARPATTGGTTVAGASTAAAQKMIEGITEIHAHAQAGGIHAKREALAAIHEGATRFAGMVQMLARQMSEPGMNYGPEITEPLAKAGQHFNAGAMTVSEADTAIEALINMTVGDLAKSPRQAPHHRELTENGSR